MELIRMIKQLVREEDGLAAIEYALIGSLIAVACVVGATALGGSINTMFNTLAGRFTG